VRRNRKFWDADSADYQAAHRADLEGAPLAWGAFRVPESELHVLGDVAGRRVLELGCGGAQWSAALSALGAHAVGLDLSRAQLAHARAKAPALAVVLADGEQPPFADRAFDVVFCDHGAMSFCDPARTLPEVARLVRPGGLFAFCNATPYPYLTWNVEKDKGTRRLLRTYDDLGRQDYGEGTVDWVLGPGDWIRLLRGHGFEIEDLLELRPPAGATTTYADFARGNFASNWPIEWIWKTRRSD